MIISLGRDEPASTPSALRRAERTEARAEDCHRLLGQPADGAVGPLIQYAVERGSVPWSTAWSRLVVVHRK